MISDAQKVFEGDEKHTLKLISAIVLHYSVLKPLKSINFVMREYETVKQLLMRWIQEIAPDIDVYNFTNDWDNAQAFGAVIEATAAGLCPDWILWTADQASSNLVKVMNLGEKWLSIPHVIKKEQKIINTLKDIRLRVSLYFQFIEPEELIHHRSEMTTIIYLSQYIGAFVTATNQPPPVGSCLYKER